MQRSDEVKKQILEGFIDIFTRICSKEYQKRVWIRGNGPECDDFDDTVCDFFGACDPILDRYKYFGIAEGQYRLLKKFRDKFATFSDANDWPSQFIDTPEWEEITEKAKEVLRVFNYQRPPR